MGIKYDTIDELKADIARMDEEIKADRASRGVPPEPPPKFVNEDVAYALIKKCAQIERFIISYAILCDEQDDVIELSSEQAEWVQGHKDYANLIRQSMEQNFVTYGMGLQSAIHFMLADSSEKYKREASVYVSRLFLAAQFMKLVHDMYHVMSIKYNELTDDELAEKVEEYVAHYESIKHLY